MKEFRIESDSVGKKEIPCDAYYGVHSLRGKENFNITGQTLHPEMIKGLAMVKKACAISNNESGLLDIDKTNAIIQACDLLLEGKYWDQMITDPIQGGAGTTANMNANEVIANIANQLLGGTLGNYEFIHPNDHVNMGQSTNDVYPTSGKLGILNLLPNYIKELELLIESLEYKSKEFDEVLKMGRTQLQDAVPIRLGQEFNAFASVLKRDLSRIKQAKESIKAINMGASAIGTGINVDLKYFSIIVPNLSKLSGYKLRREDDLIDQTSNLDSLVEISSVLKTNAVNLSKISNDLRLLSSGPKTMIGDIILPARQNGSSIMPGKINPVIPEVVSQVSFRVIGNDLTVTMAAEAGQLQLNAFEPVIFYSIYQSIEMLTAAMETLRLNAIEGIKSNDSKLSRDINKSVGTITALVPHIGYKKAAEIADEALATNTPVRDLVEKNNLMSKEDLDQIFDAKAMTQPGIAARHLLLK